MPKNMPTKLESLPPIECSLDITLSSIQLGFLKCNGIVHNVNMQQSAVGMCASTCSDFTTIDTGIKCYSDVSTKEPAICFTLSSSLSTECPFILKPIKPPSFPNVAWLEGSCSITIVLKPWKASTFSLVSFFVVQLRNSFQFLFLFVFYFVLSLCPVFAVLDFKGLCNYLP